ncbi:MAG TPA: pyridoxamine 5'-phosphate oxidase family protein [Aurantimonas coralicida]|uniref:Pyridoxamine 5'-phosphate oxidase family protein n=2 Tax=root TaxID=1 RepID=A0A9C9NF35_9HYPH|nr:pyridoxamine 5'-phosphate oxidase family protein [Aurantimonas coralicida]HEU00456.1 pyridoxamine 5'-phosphate oxidase family protein [Aurantimonas coralicida]
MTKIATIEALRALYGSPSVRAAQKQLPRLDAHAKAFLGRSPFMLIGSSSPGKLPDVSPKGGEPGFAAIIDDTHIAIPDRPGNKRLDTYENLLANPIVGLLFLLPGMDETLRVNGTAEIRTDDELLDRCAYEGKRPISVLLVEAKEVYFHCAKAFMRSGLWDADKQIDRATMPTLGAMLKDQIGLSGEIQDIDREMVERYKVTMY